MKFTLGKTGIFKKITVRNITRDQDGLSLLEVIISTLVLGVAIAGFLMALSTAATTSTIARNESTLVYLATREFEALRNANFEDLPFFQTDTPGNIQEVPDYFRDLAISDQLGGTVNVVASGDLQTAYSYYSRNAAFDGKRAHFNQGPKPTRWMGADNSLGWDDQGGGPIIGDPFGGGDPIIGDPGGDPIIDDPGEIAPKEYQYIFCAFPVKTKISRILYDNRFNVSEKMPGPSDPVPPDHMDYLPHLEDTWQRNFDFFYSADALEYGEIYEPWRRNVTPLELIKDQGYGSSDIWVIFNNPVEPLECGVLGVHNIDTYTDYDAAFHYPYISEIEVYGYSNATNYVEEWRTEAGEHQYNNVIMYFPDYLGSGFDLARRTYIDATSLGDAIQQRKELVHVVIEFYPATNSSRLSTWQRLTWWQDDTSELARFQTSFYRDTPTRVDRLPNLGDYPEHKIYDNNEDILLPFTVPGASEIRAKFGDFDLEPGPGTDWVTVEDADGNVYMGPLSGDAGLNIFTPWIPGDTIVLHFVSNPQNNSYDMFYRGFEVARIEVRWIGVDSLNQ